MRGKIEQVNQAALAFIQASNRQDQVFLIGFNEDVELLQDSPAISTRSRMP